MNATDQTKTRGAKTRRSGMRRVLTRLKRLVRPDRYRPERHYMRGPGPACQRADEMRGTAARDPADR